MQLKQLLQIINKNKVHKVILGSIPVRAKRAAILTVTDKAALYIKKLLDERGQPAEGIRLGVKARGCSGYSYTLEYADEQDPLDEVVQCDAFKVLIAPKAAMFFIGTIMDYEEEDLGQGFIFKNPNEKGRCGCGESFHV